MLLLHSSCSLKPEELDKPFLWVYILQPWLSWYASSRVRFRAVCVGDGWLHKLIDNLMGSERTLTGGSVPRTRPQHDYNWCLCFYKHSGHTKLYTWGCSVSPTTWARSRVQLNNHSARQYGWCVLLRSATIPLPSCSQLSWLQKKKKENLCCHQMDRATHLFLSALPHLSAS